MFSNRKPVRHRASTNTTAPSTAAPVLCQLIHKFLSRHKVNIKILKLWYRRLCLTTYLCLCSFFRSNFVFFLLLSYDPRHNDGDRKAKLKHRCLRQNKQWRQYARAVSAVTHNQSRELCTIKCIFHTHLHRAAYFVFFSGFFWRSFFGCKKCWSSNF